MRVLFLIDDVYDPYGATNKLAKELAGELNCAEIVVSVLRNISKENVKKLLIQPQIEEISFFSAVEKRLYDEVARIRKDSGNIFFSALKLLFKPILLVTAINLFVFKTSPMESIFKREIEKACNNNKYDVVISFSCPHYTSFALAKAKINAKKIAYFMDPYSESKAMKLLYSKKKESGLLKRIDKLIVTEQMYKRVDTNKQLSQYKDKLVPMYFPGIQDLKYDKSIDSLKFYEGKIRISYIGNFYLEIRRPDFMLELFKSIKDRCEFCLNLIGGGKDAFGNDYWENVQNEFKDSINLVNSVPTNVALNAVLDSDILVNVGNSDSLFLPSKILEYISSKKPIINIYKIGDCPTLALLKDYQLALNIKESQASIKDSSEQVLRFIEESNGKTCDDILSYDRYTLKSVTENLATTINELFN